MAAFRKLFTSLGARARVLARAHAPLPVKRGPESPMALRENFVQAIAANSRILEIGPFCTPVVEGSNVRYFDVLDSEGLSRRARELGLDVTTPPHIDFVSPTGDLSLVHERFSAVVSSHCIEHQPDLVRHLKQVSEILHDVGRYFLLIPDRRYCFDHFIDKSNVAEVIEAHIEKREVHRIASVIEHLALTTHNDPRRHWRGDHADANYFESIPPRIEQAVQVHASSSGGYLDVHAWQFDPDGFRQIIETLFALRHIDLQPECIYDTPADRFEFTAVLRKRARQPAANRARDSQNPATA
jgi:hypothetical protein